MTPSLADTAEATWARIIPFLRPIEALIRDPEISDILVNGDRAVFFERNGRLEPLAGVTVREQSLQVAARNIARALGDEISEENPILVVRLGGRDDDCDPQIPEQALQPPGTPARRHPSSLRP
ncbi:MAG: hypothetical protein DMF89_08725 [Acidobacteria bacterium]|nr:MAG: hypothetical protein DMF89_08725 [Acidobacteriota bacterium]